MPLQKSFSDQNHSNKKKRTSWTRNKSFHGPNSRNEPVAVNPTHSLKPILISSATKNKLSSFQFEEPQKRLDLQDESGASKKQIMDENNKENDSMVDTVDKCILISSSQPERPTTSQGSASNPKRDVPRTPAGRLALPDLIGMVDFRTVEQEKSPDERIIWEHDQDTSYGSQSSYNARKRRKRARSSSPHSSPHLRTSNHFPASKIFKELQKTPQADPGLDLWDRLGLNLNRQTPNGVPLSSLAHIMQTSSPQQTNGAVNPRLEATLRRAISCGTQWPKRRRVVGKEDSIDEDLFMESESAGPSKLKQVSALLEKVHEGRATGTVTNGPSSSSPIPDRYTISRYHETSPLRHKHTAALGVIPETCSSQRHTTPIKTESDGDEIMAVADSPSDYGDFDDDELDESVFKALDANISTQFGIYKEASSPLRAVGATIKPISPVKEPVSAISGKTSRSTSSKTLQADSDSFGDSDDDLFDGMLNIASKYDQKNAGTEETVKEANTVKSIPKKVQVMESDDEFDDDLDETDFAVAEATATQSIYSGSIQPTEQKVRAIQRYLVTNVLEEQYKKNCWQKILLVKIDNSEEIRTIYLRDGWWETPIILSKQSTTYVHVIGKFENNACIIDDHQGMLILHPDHLISSTVVADSFTCMRRAVLQDRVKATSESSAPLVYGTILHEIFQAAMFANRWDTAWLYELIQLTVQKHLELLYTIKVRIPQAVEHLQSKMGELQCWAQLFVSAQPKSGAIVKAGNSATAEMCVSKLLDVEEHVWSPLYGLKGNIDATVQVTMQDGKDRRTLTAPFEVKTGKNVTPSHRAQTALYNLLLSDRYDIEIAYGVLYYMETSETFRIPAIRHEIRHMIMKRNELSCYVREKAHTNLPPMLKQDHLCNRCYAKVPCFIYHKLAEDGSGETSGLKGKFDEIVKHLSPVHKEFFLKWDKLLTQEEKESMKFRRELWTMLSPEREKLGRCFANVIIEPGSAYEEKEDPKINRFRYTLIKQNPQAGFSFLESQITIGEAIVISDEKGHFALANGYVTHVHKHRITVAVDRRLHNARIRQPGFDEVNNQVFASIMEVAGEGAKLEEAEGKIVDDPVLYRLDKDEFSNGMALVRNNIIQIMAEGPFGSREIRSLVVDLKQPQFKLHSTAYTLKDRKNINIDQRRAIEKVMSAQNYALVLGMPGTGKTTTIAHIIRALVSQGKSVLLTSYTHTAVDNILLKLRDDNIPILRLGATAKISNEVQEFVHLATTPKSSFEEIRHVWHDSPIVATTCLGINHSLFNERTFDYCIVDEASQITLPVCLGPIRLARTFILVGDHNQLPPLVQNEEARLGGLDISLFKHLSDSHPSAVVNLEHQYRMCAEVMALSNSLIYNGRLKCGTPEVAQRSIHIPNMAALAQLHHNPSTIRFSQPTNVCLGPTSDKCWIRTMLNPARKVAFINTDPLIPESREQAKGNRIVNHIESQICTQLVTSLIAVGVPAHEIGVMTHYRSQLSLLKYQMRNQPGVEMHTADRFQGRDKEVIILSLVRNNEARSIGELLKDWRRINVAFTRAKTKLLVVGSRETLKGGQSDALGGTEMVARFVGLMEERKWVYDFPTGGLESHVFEELATQTQALVPVKAVEQKAKSPKRESVVRDAERNKENRRPEPKRVQAGKRVILKERGVLRDIHNDLARY